MKVADLIHYLEQVAPPAYQEDYDNAGLIVGNPEAELTGVLCCLDSTEAVVEEAVETGCNLIVAHHPIVFRGLKQLTGSSYVERTVISAIRQEVAIYAIHTNLDNVYQHGVNARIAERLGLEHTSILAPKAALQKLACWGEASRIDRLRKQLMEDNLILSGHVLSGEPGQAQLEAVVESARVGEVVGQLGPEVRYSLQALRDKAGHIGSGMVGLLPEPMEEMAFLHYLKDRMQTECIKHTPLLARPVHKVALCGGSGSFLLPRAIAAGADVFITGDFKYHEYFDADGKLVIADIGHYESEQFTIALLRELLSSKFPNFAIRSTQVVTNPVRYL